MKTQIATGLALCLMTTSAQADVVVGNPMAQTGPIPDLVAPMVQAVDLAAEHINAQGGMFAAGENFTIARADSQCDPVAAVDAVEEGACPQPSPREGEALHASAARGGRGRPKRPRRATPSAGGACSQPAPL